MSYFGIPIRNGLPIGLGSVAPLASGGGSPFSPLSLFSGGTPGAWYDPSDYSTLFQDSAGTTPVTAVEQPVGLMLDKSQGLVLGSELVPDSSFDSAASWTAQNSDWVVAGGKATYTESATAVVYLESNANISLDAGKWYEINCTFSGIASGSAVFGLFNKTASVNLLGGYVIVATNGTYVQRIFVASSVTGIRIYGNNSGSSTSWSLDSFSIKELPGNHAFQSTSASRPVLSARYNLLTKTEQFDDAVWPKSDVTVTANAATAPDGTSTADKLIASATNANHLLNRAGSISVTAGSTCTFSMYAKAAEYGFVRLQIQASAFAESWANFNLTTGAVGLSTGVTSAIQSVGNGWYRCSVTATATSTTGSGVQPFVLDSNRGTTSPSYTGDGTSGILIWGADFRVSNDGITQPAYQRVNTATDYATTGFLPYLKFDGVDDSLSTNSISFTSTDKMSVFAGVRKLSDAATGMIYETSQIYSSFSGAVSLYTTSSNYKTSSGGSVFAEATSSSLPSPLTNVLTELASISADQLILRVNGVQNAQSTADQGTGNYGNYPLFIGRRNNTNFPFNGQLYSMVIVGKAVTASELTNTETYVNQKTGAY